MPLYAIDGKRPRLGTATWIAPDASVIGDAVLGTSVNLWFGAVVRADNTPIVIGAGTNVQEGAMLHSDPGAPLTIGAGCTIGHHAILHGATIGDRVLIGMGATVLNRAVVGDDCIVGAGALLTEDKRFAAGSLILGSPARTIRRLSDAERATLRASAAHYAARAARYATGLERIDPPGF